jgi:hypothetical protein
VVLNQNSSDFSTQIEAASDNLIDSFGSETITSQTTHLNLLQQQDLPLQSSEHVFDYNVKDFIVNSKFAQAFGKALSNIPAFNSQTGKPNLIYLTLVETTSRTRNCRPSSTCCPSSQSGASRSRRTPNSPTPPSRLWAPYCASPFPTRPPSADSPSFGL